jgi:hypothetical protein
MTLEDSASIAQLIIAVIAVLAFGSAVYAILDQRSIARKRAALDLFVKAELDRAMVETYDKYNKAADSLRDDRDRCIFQRKSRDWSDLFSTYTSLSPLGFATRF